MVKSPIDKIKSVLTFIGRPSEADLVFDAQPEIKRVYRYPNTLPVRLLKILSNKERNLERLEELVELVRNEKMAREWAASPGSTIA
ncbi:hypothetical protein QFZ54_000010 [Sphingomonas faeni]|nr:hypothetical protein [Sphingomonas faeni]